MGSLCNIYKEDKKWGKYNNNSYRPKIKTYKSKNKEIDKSWYKEKYKEIQSIVFFRYLQTTNKLQKLISRFHWGNEENENIFWLEETQKVVDYVGKRKT